MNHYVALHKDFKRMQDHYVGQVQSLTAQLQTANSTIKELRSRERL